MPSNYEGYYNFQHMQAPGVEWAIEVWFYVDGTGELKSDGGSVAFTYTPNQWMNIQHDISLDDDEATIEQKAYIKVIRGYRGKAEQEMIEKARKALMLVDLENRINHFPSQLSGGLKYM